MAFQLLDDPFFRRFFDIPNARSRERQKQSLGSGVIVDAARGYILTNHHVIEGADEITTTLRDQRQYTAEVVGSDPEVDLALIRIKAKDLMDLRLLTLPRCAWEISSSPSGALSGWARQ